MAAAALKSKTSHRNAVRVVEVVGPRHHDGQNIGELCRSLYEREGRIAVRRILGVLSYAKKYGAATCDEACELAMETGSGTYHFVRKYLERRPATSLTLRQIDPIIRQLTIYRDLIERRELSTNPHTSTQENAPL